MKSVKDSWTALEGEEGAGGHLAKSSDAHSLAVPTAPRGRFKDILMGD